MFEYFFFFQAEDGIRGSSVTGVQTCALPIWSSGTYTANRRPLCRPYRTWLGCCSPDKQARQFSCPHRLRRKLSEPRIAGHKPAASLWIQRTTSAGDSVVARIIADAVPHHTSVQQAKPAATKR